MAPCMVEDPLHYLDTGKFADFTIHCGGCSWKTHRIIISQRSEYFARLCDSQFKEAIDQAVTLEEDDPELIARLLIFLYTSKYASTRHADSMAFGSLKRLLASNGQLDFGQSERENPLTLHASLYGTADKYECPSLKKVCQGLFVNTLSGDFSVPDFISSINVVYETTSDTDKGLRKWALWVSQGYTDMLQLHPGFKSLFSSRPDFAWDFVTQYQAANRFWCTFCHASVPSFCNCGNHGLCRQNKTCKAERMEDIECYRCETTGGVVSWSAAPASNNPRQLFTSDTTDEALKRRIATRYGTSRIAKS